MSILSAVARQGRRQRPLLSLRPSSPVLTQWRSSDDEDDDYSRERSSMRGVSGVQQRRFSAATTSTSFQSSNLLHLKHRRDHLWANHYYQPSSNSNASNNHSAIFQRKYHATPQKQILPLIAVGVVGAGAVYTYRALQQMDQDWEEYYELLEEYKEKTGIDPEAIDADAEVAAAAAGGNAASNTSSNAKSDDLSSYFTGGTLALDMGSTRLKLSHRSRLQRNDNNNKSPPAPIVSVDREGSRSTPSLVWFDSDNNALVGRLAASHHQDVINPHDALARGEGADENLAIKAAREAIRTTASNALDQVIGSSSSSSTKQQNPLFVLDSSIAVNGSYNVRPIFTCPMDSTYLDRYQKAVNDLTMPPGIATFVPEPLAIVTGAEYYNLLPSKSMSGGDSVMVVDVGGTTTNVSMVSSSSGEKEVIHSTSLPFGGNTFIDLLTCNLIQSFFGTNPQQTSDDTNAPPTSKPKLNDPDALHRLYEASTTAIHELSRKTRSQINIPYLTMDLETRQPRHLEVGMARSVVDSEVNEFLRDKIVPHLKKASSPVLSQAVPSPNNLQTLLSSILMSALEQTSHTPFMLRGILLVGGGARIPLVKSAMKETVEYLTGEDKMLIVPEGELGEELAVLGAAVMGSGEK